MGGGISNAHGTLTLTHSTVARNSGGGISDFRGTSTLTDTRVVGNSSEFDGGGIHIFNGSLTLTNSTVAGNSAGLVWRRDPHSRRQHGHPHRAHSRGQRRRGSGGGISSQALGEGRLDVTLTLINSTVSGNSAEVDGGGIFNNSYIFGAPAELALINSTVAGNSAARNGGGIDRATGSDLTLINSLVAQNEAPTGPDVLRRKEEIPVFARFSVIGDGTGSGLTNTNGNQVGTAGAPIDPKLAPLANYGGPSATHRLMPGSPAIDAASTPDCPATDQRGRVVLRGRPATSAASSVSCRKTASP